jgi:hypothetical protein
MPLWTALYISQAALDLSPADVSALVDRACASNAEAGITGALLYYRSRFIQVLEGEQADVEMLLSRISQDLRHHDMTVVHRGAASERVFGKWSMREVLAGRENEPVVEDFLHRLSDQRDDSTWRTAVALMLRLTNSSLPKS